MVFQLCTKRFYLEGPMHGLFPVAGGKPLLMTFGRNSRVLHDTRNLVTSAGEPGKHNFLCLIQVSRAAGGTREGRSLGPLPVLPTPELVVPRSQLPSVRDVYVETLRVTFTCLKNTPSGCCPSVSGASTCVLRSLKVVSDFKDTFLFPAGFKFYTQSSPVTARFNVFSASDPSSPDELFTGLCKGPRSDRCCFLEFLPCLTGTKRNECRLLPTQ